MPAHAIIVLVLLLDAFVLFAGGVFTMHPNQLGVMRAVRAQHDNPTLETQRRLDAEVAKERGLRERGRNTVGVTLLVITAGGPSLAGWQLRRERREIAALDSAVSRSPNT